MPRIFSVTAYLLRAKMKARYWRRYALRLERQLEGEKQRNQAREDALNTSYLQMMGMYGVPPRTGPAQPRIPLASQPFEAPPPYNLEPWDQLTPFEQKEFSEIYWREDGQGEAQQAGVPYERARHDFAKQILQNRFSGKLM